MVHSERYDLFEKPIRDESAKRLVDAGLPEVDVDWQAETGDDDLLLAQLIEGEDPNCENTDDNAVQWLKDNTSGGYVPTHVPDEDYVSLARRLRERTASEST